MSTLTVYADTTDGQIRSTSNTYATARAGAALAAATAATLDETGQRWTGSNYLIDETFFGFDTSSLGASASVSAAIFSLYGFEDHSDTDFTWNCYLYDWGVALATGDWVAGASLSGLTLLGTFATTSFSAAGYNDFSDVAFAANVSKTGTTRVMTASSRQESGNTPTGDEYVYSYFADQTGTTKDPKLVVTYTSGAQGTGALTLPFLSVAGTGVKSYPGTSAITLPSPLSVAGSGLQTQLSQAAFLIPIVQIAGVGAYIAPPSGTGALTLPVPTVLGAGHMVPEGIAAFTLPSPLAVVGSGLKVYDGTGVFSLPVVTVSGSGRKVYTATGAFTIPLIAFTGTGLHIIPGTGAFSIPLIAFSATGAQLISGTGALSIPVVIISTGIGLLVLPRKALEYLLELPNYSGVIEVPSYSTILKIVTNSKVLTLPELTQTTPIQTPETTVREL